MGFVQIVLHFYLNAAHIFFAKCNNINKPRGACGRLFAVAIGAFKLVLPGLIWGCLNVPPLSAGCFPAQNIQIIVDNKGEMNDLEGDYSHLDSFEFECTNI